MANTLTGLIEFVYQSADTVSREMVGLIPAVTLNSAADQVAKDQSVSYDIAPAPTNYDVAASNALPALDSSTMGVGTMAITKVRANKFHWTGEDERAIGRSKESIQNNKFAQAFRALANEMEADLAALYVHASRAYGTSGTTPFGTAGDFTDAAEVRRILVDNGAPASDLQLVLNSAAGASIRAKQAQVYMQGDSGNLLRQGVLLDIHGMQIRESAQILTHTKGAGTGYTINNGNVAVGSTTLTFDGATVNTTGIKAGDIITINASTTNKYVIKTGSTATSGDIVIQDPGLRSAIVNDQAVALLANYAANMAFARSAIHLLTRLPLMPERGDQAMDVTVVQDPVSGMFFQVAMYPGYRCVLIEVAIAWGVKAVKPEHIAILQG